jgi:hypothetical protein
MGDSWNADDDVKFLSFSSSKGESFFDASNDDDDDVAAALINLRSLLTCRRF